MARSTARLPKSSLLRCCAVSQPMWDGREGEPSCCLHVWRRLWYVHYHLCFHELRWLYSKFPTVGRREPTFIPDQMAKWLKCFLVFVSVELEFEVLICGLQLCGNFCVLPTQSFVSEQRNEIYFVERLYFSATNYFIFIVKLDFQSPWLSRGNELPERMWRFGVFN